MRAYVINLDHRHDRLETQIHQAESLGLDLVRVNAVYGKTWDGKGWKKQGRSVESRWRGLAGCYFSHTLALEQAISNDVFPCMILEDDCVLSEAPVAEPGMVYLGGFESAKGIYGTHAIMYNTKADAEGFYNYVKSHKNTADSVANMYRKANPAMIKKYSKGFIATQKQNYSDIETCVVGRTADGKLIH